MIKLLLVSVALNALLIYRIYTLHKAYKYSLEVQTTLTEMMESSIATQQKLKDAAEVLRGIVAQPKKEEEVKINSFITSNMWN